MRRRKGGRGRGYRGLTKVKKGSSGCTRQPRAARGEQNPKNGPAGGERVGVLTPTPKHIGAIAPRHM